MNRLRSLLTVEWAVVVFCAWHCAQPLMGTWCSAPFDRLGWLAFLLWFSPVVASVAWSDRLPQVRIAWLTWVAVGMQVAAVLANINALSYLGLALALGGILPPGKNHLFWMLLSFSWQPVLGIALFRFLPVNAIIVIRVLLAAVAAVISIKALNSLRMNANHEDAS
jgi:hypothetical protein